MSRFGLVSSSSSSSSSSTTSGTVTTALLATATGVLALLAWRAVRYVRDAPTPPHITPRVFNTARDASFLKSSSSSSRRVAVLGASGPLGRAILELCVAHGVRASAIVRRMPSASDASSAAAAVRHALIEYVVLADPLGDVAALSGAIAGHDAVLSAVGEPNVFRATTLYSHGIGRVVASAVARANVPLLVVCTAAGTCEAGARGELEFDANNGVGLFELLVKPLILRRIYVDMSRLEFVELPKAAIDYTIVCPPRLLDTAAEGDLLYAVGHSFRGRPSMARRDVAAFMLHCALAGNRDASPFARKSVHLRGNSH